MLNDTFRLFFKIRDDEFALVLYLNSVFMNILEMSSLHVTAGSYIMISYRGINNFEILSQTCLK